MANHRDPELFQGPFIQHRVYTTFLDTLEFFKLVPLKFIHHKGLHGEILGGKGAPHKWGGGKRVLTWMMGTN